MNTQYITSIETGSLNNNSRNYCNYSIMHEIRRGPEHRKANLRLLRAIFCSSQKEFSRMIGIQSQSKYSTLERGEETLSSANARKLEKDLKIPDNWLDCDNTNTFFLTEEERILLDRVRNKNPALIPIIVKMI